MVLLWSFGDFWDFFFSCFRRMPGVVLVDGIRVLLSDQYVDVGITVMDMKSNCHWTANAWNIAVEKSYTSSLPVLRILCRCAHGSSVQVTCFSLITLWVPFPMHKTFVSLEFFQNSCLPCVSAVIVQELGDFFLLSRMNNLFRSTELWYTWIADPQHPHHMEKRTSWHLEGVSLGSGVVLCLTRGTVSKLTNHTPAKKT